MSEQDWYEPEPDELPEWMNFIGSFWPVTVLCLILFGLCVLKPN